jgi:hypothetical protein
MSQLLETVAVIVGTFMTVGGLGMNAASFGSDDSTTGPGCLMAVLGIALIVGGLGFYSHWSMHNL